jgi:hypothetical protein
VRTRPDEAQVKEIRLLHSMDATANINLVTKASTKPILRHLNKQKGRWLNEASRHVEGCA